MDKKGIMQKLCTDDIDNKSICITCPILLTCRHKRTKPEKCTWRPAPMKPRSSTPEPDTKYGIGEYLTRMARQERFLRAGVIDFAGDFG